MEENRGQKIREWISRELSKDNTRRPVDFPVSDFLHEQSLWKGMLQVLPVYFPFSRQSLVFLGNTCGYLWIFIVSWHLMERVILGRT